MKTTTERLVQLYDKTIEHLEKKLDDGSISGTELGELRKLLDAGAILQLVRAGQPDGKASNAVAPADLPFPSQEDLQPGDFPELAQVRVYQ